LLFQESLLRFKVFRSSSVIDFEEDGFYFEHHQLFK